MTRKHFQAFAQKIEAEVERLERQGYDPGRNPAAFLHLKRTAEMIGEVCIEMSDNFDYGRFIAACKLPDIDAEKALVDLQKTMLQEP